MLKPNPATNVTSLIDAIQSYHDVAGTTKWLVQPLVKLSSDSTAAENADEVIDIHTNAETNADPHQLLDTIISSLRALDASDFAETFTTFPQPYADYPELDTTICVPFHLPAVLVPPEIVELDGISAESSEEPKARLGEWPIYHVRLFDKDVRCFCFHVYGSVSRTMSGHTGSQHARWLCYSIYVGRYNRYLRSQSERMCPPVARISKVDPAWHFQTQTRRINRS